MSGGSDSSVIDLICSPTDKEALQTPRKTSKVALGEDVKAAKVQLSRPVALSAS